MRQIQLYKRNAKGEPIKWELVEQELTLILSTGIVGKTSHTSVIDRKRVKKNEFDARVAEKRKAGYKEVSELYDNAPRREELINSGALISYLQQYLPKYNTNDNGIVFPMLAKILESNKPFEKADFLGQWKINGVRCIIHAEKVPNDLFNPLRLRYFSREGTEWTNMSFMDKIIIPYLSKQLLEAMIEEGVALDGELYLPGHTVNDINSFVKNDRLPQHYQLQYWCYDLMWDDMCYEQRRVERKNGINSTQYSFHSLNEHLNNKKQLIVLPDENIMNINMATEIRDKYIDLGFEGLIIRNLDSNYQFGKRNSAMFKYKKVLDGKFKVIDIVPEGVRTYLPKFVCQNDINDEQFEATINLPQANQREILDTKDNFIGKTVLVEYRERSGVKQVPFHAKIIKFL